MPEEEPKLAISAAFILPENETVGWVWAESGRGRLERRQVKLGAYDPMTDTYEILEGLTEDDFIAFPDEELCVEGAPTTHEVVTEEGGVS